MNKKKKDNYYVLWSGMIVLCIVLVLFSLIFVSCSPGNDATDNSPSPTETPSGEDVTGTAPVTSESPTPSPTGTEQETPTVLAQTDDMGQEYVDKFVFLGDSTTYGLGYYGIVPTSQIWTPTSGTLTLSQWSFTAISYPDTGEEIMIVDAVKDKKPEYMLITLGVNGVSFMDEEYFKTEYTNLVNAVKEASPDTKIILNSIYPVAPSYEHLDSINNEKINAANEWIQQIAEDTGTRYLNSCTTLVGADGFLPETYHNGDGMHLNTDSFNLVIDYLRTHGYK
jgi:lysophospholipase L1-like esterase